MKTDLDSLLETLARPDQPIPLARLPELSDLDAEELRRFARAWDSLSADRRSALLVELRRLADEHVEFTFDRVNRLALQAPEPQVRRQAIENLWECEEWELVPPLVQALEEDSAAEVRAAAATALGSFIYLGELERIPERMRLRAEAALLRASQSDTGDGVRRASVESLGYSSRPEVPALIREAFASPEEAWKRAALVAMGRSADKPWGPMVIAELVSPAPGLRFEAARASGELELADAIPGLIDLLEDVDTGVRRAAIWSLSQIGGDAAAQALNRLHRRAEDPGEVELLEQALENLAFVDGTRDMLLFDFDEDDEAAP